VKPIFGVVVITAVLFIAMAGVVSPLRPSVPALQFTFSEAAFNSVIAAWPPDGIERFRTHLVIDFAFLVSYGVLGWLLSVRTRLFAQWSPAAKMRMAVCLPFAAGADAIENLLHFFLVSGAGTTPSLIYLLAGIVATLKWLLIAIFMINAAWSLLLGRSR